MDQVSQEKKNRNNRVMIAFIVILIILGALLVFAQSTGIAPFIYSII